MLKHIQEQNINQMKVRIMNKKAFNIAKFICILSIFILLASCAPIIAPSEDVVKSNKSENSHQQNIIPQGQLLWQYKISGEVNSAPIYYNNRIFAASKDGVLYALKANSGACEWKYKTDSAITNSSPVVYGNQIYIGGENGKLYAISVNTGDAEWYYQTKAPIHSPPEVRDRRVYYGSRDRQIYSV